MCVIIVCDNAVSWHSTHPNGGRVCDEQFNVMLRTMILAISRYIYLMICQKLHIGADLIILVTGAAEGPAHTGSIIYCNIRHRIIDVKIINSKAIAQHLRYNELNIVVFVASELS